MKVGHYKKIYSVVLLGSVLELWDFKCCFRRLCASQYMELIHCYVLSCFLCKLLFISWVPVMASWQFLLLLLLPTLFYSQMEPSLSLRNITIQKLYSDFSVWEKDKIHSMVFHSVETQVPAAHSLLVLSQPPGPGSQALTHSGSFPLQGLCSDLSPHWMTFP